MQLRCFYTRNMSAPIHDWYFREWLSALHLKQARIVELTGWSKGKVSKLYNGDAQYTRDIVNEVARAIHVRPFELLLHPEDAMAIRRLRESAVTIAADAREGYKSFPAFDEDEEADRRKAS